MKKTLSVIMSGTLLLAVFGCRREGIDVPDEALAGLHKPVVTRISPAGILSGGANVPLHMEGDLRDDFYVLYINDRQIGESGRAGFGMPWWSIPQDLLRELLAASPGGVTCSVRITGIRQAYDISGDFDRYRDVVSAPMLLEIKKGETRFSQARNLFPQWGHASDPVIRCDAHGNLSLAWREKVGDRYHAFFSFSQDGGANWSQALNVSRSKNSVDKVDLAADGEGHFFLAWSEGRDVHFCRSLNNGASWLPPVKMNSMGERASKPVIAVNGRGDVLQAWYSRDAAAAPSIRLAVSPDLGENWQYLDFATPNSTHDKGTPVLIPGSGGALSLWSGCHRNDGSKGAYFFASGDFGRSWEEREVSTGSIYPFLDYALGRAGVDNQIQAVWGNVSGLVRDGVPLPWNYFLRWGNSGDARSEVQALHDICFTVHGKTALSVSGEAVQMVLPGIQSLFLLRSRDGGGSWSYPQFIPETGSSTTSHSPDMVLHPSGKTFLAFIRPEEPWFPQYGPLWLIWFD